MLGDGDGVLVSFLREHEVAAEERDVGRPRRRTSPAMTSSSSTAASRPWTGSRRWSARPTRPGRASVFTGTWGVLNGGLRMLAQHRPDEVAIGGQGFRDGAVTLTGFDGAHPLFAGLTAPATPLAPDSYYSFLDRFQWMLAPGGDPDVGT